MKSEFLRLEIEKFHQLMAEKAPLFALARQGLIKRHQIQRYLENLQFTLRETQVRLAEAARQSQARGLLELHAFFSEKVVEEKGHDAWAEDDLQRLNIQDSGRYGDIGITQSIRDLLTYMDKTIAIDPSLYVGYVLLAEYFTVLVSPEFLENLESRCKIPREAMSVVVNHGILDKQHAEDDLRMIEEIGDRFASPEEMLSSLHAAMRIFWNFFHEVVEDVAEPTVRQWARPPSWLAV